MRSCLCPLVLLGCIAPAACGKAVDSAAGADAGPGDDGSGDDDPADGDDLDGGDRPDGGDGDDDAPRGLIVAESTTFTDETGLHQTSTARAFFGDYETEDCALELADGDCRLLSCRPRPAATPFPEAGLIVIQVDTIDQATLTPGEQGAYNAFGAEAPLFADGAEVAAFAAGADVPAFDIDLQAPSSIAFTVPVPSSGSAIGVSAANDYDLTWAEPDSPDQVHVTISALPDQDRVRRVIDCGQFGPIGHITVSSEILSLVPPGDLDFEARVEASDTVRAGAYAVTMTASVVARQGDGQDSNAARGTLVLSE